MEGIRKAMNERNLNEGQWEDRKQWSLGFGQRRTKFLNRYIHTHTHTHIHKYIHIYIHKKVSMAQTDYFPNTNDALYCLN